MQKKFIALAVAGLVSGAAFAQSNVTIYGVADASFEYVSVPGSTTGTNNTGSYTRVGTNSSLIGFKGEEALGNGLKAIFQMENAVLLDNSSGLIGGRDTFVGLEGGFGKVQLGLLTSPSRALGAAVDMNAGAAGVGSNQNLIGKPLGVNASTGSNGAGTGGTNSGTFDSRLANTIAYTSPNFGGVNLIAAYSSGENRTNDGTVNASKTDTRTYDLGAIYSNGPIYAGLTYGKQDTKREGTFTNVTTAATTSTTGAASTIAVTPGAETSLFRLAGTYTFGGGHKIGALYEQNRVDHGAAGIRTESRQNTWGLGGKFMVTPAGGLIAQYYRANDASRTNSAVANDTGATMYELGYEHSLSKRTMLKATYAQINNRNNAAFNFGAAGNTASVTGGADPRVISAGVRHSF